MSDTQTGVQTIKARRANTAAANLKHYSLTRVINESDTRKFAFALSDDGEEEIYIPGLIVERYNLSIYDEGAGFKCMVRKKTGYDNDGGHPHAMLPIYWDDEPQEIKVVGDAAPAAPDYPDVTEDLDRLANEINDVVGDLGKIEALVKDCEDRVAKAQAEKAVLTTILTRLRTVEKTLDEVCPEIDE